MKLKLKMNQEKKIIINKLKNQKIIKILKILINKLKKRK